MEIKAIFDESRGSAGKRTIKSRLAMNGIFVGLYLIAKLMKQLQLVSKQPKKHRHYDKERGEIFSNHLARQFTPEAETTVLCGDTTYIRMAFGAILQWLSTCLIVRLSAGN